VNAYNQYKINGINNTSEQYNAKNSKINTNAFQCNSVHISHHETTQ